VVWYGQKILSLAFREESRQTMLENRVLRNTFGPNTVEVRGEKPAK
jgi:hypothetical protein